MLSSEDLDHIYEFFLLRGMEWMVRGSRKIPTRDEIEFVINDCIYVVRGEPESVSVEIGSLLVKRTDDKIDIYVHAGELEYDD